MPPSSGGTLPNDADASPAEMKPELPKSKIEKDPEYDRTMTALIVQIHKVTGELHRKNREYSLQVMKSKSNPMTAGSTVETTLNQMVTNSKQMLSTLDKVEADHATGVYVSHERQVEVKTKVAKLYDMVKNGNKLKLIEGADLLRSHPYSLHHVHMFMS